MVRRKNQRPFCAYISRIKVTKVQLLTINMEIDNELERKAGQYWHWYPKKPFSSHPLKAKQALYMFNIAVLNEEVAAS